MRWSTSGSFLIVQSQKTINFYSTVRCRRSSAHPSLSHLLQKLEVLHTLEHGSRIHDVKFVRRVGGGGDVLLVAAEDKMTTGYEVSPNTDVIPRPITRLIGHGNRCVMS